MNKQSLEQQTEDLNRLPEDTPGQRIRKLRLKAGYSQKELSKLLGFTSNYLGQVERDSTPLSKNMTLVLCNLFHVDFSYLHHGIRPVRLEEQDRVQESLSGGHNIRTLLNDLIDNCSGDECRMLEPIVESLLYSIRETGWIELPEDGQTGDKP